MVSLFSQFWMAGQSSSPFPHLQGITNNSNSEVHLYLEKNKAEVINKKLKDLVPNHPFYTTEGCESEMTLLAITRIDASDKRYAIIYGYCPEPEFHFYKENDLSISYGSISGLNLFLPGNGNLYTTGHVNSNFNLKRKFKFEENNIKEVEQPFYHVGKLTKTLKPLSLYKTKELKDVVAKLPKDYNVEVLLAESSHEREGFYLIKTDFGLVGWTKVIAGQHQSIDIKGIFWNGN